MKIQLRRLSRSLYIAAALAVGSVAFLPVLEQTVFAAGQLTTRSITMSDSTASTTNVTYTVQFNFGTTNNVQGIIVDFCDNDPIIMDTTCTLPGGFSITATPAVSGQSSSGSCNLSTFTTAAQLNSNRTLELTAASAVSMTSGCTGSFNLTTVTNPNTANHTFYARIYTYATTAGANGYTVANPDAGAVHIDAGGIALSTAANITVTAKVQEQLTFCVYTGANCGAGGTAVTLGTNGVLSSATSYVDKSTKYDVQTNAQSGATVKVKGATLTSGANTIAAITGSPALYASNTSQFGICTYESTGANLSPAANYVGTNGGNNCTNTTQGAGGDGSSKFFYGATGATADTISNATAGPSSTGIVAILGGTSTTQVAGIYTATLIFIATGTY
jgi:hypothetical protein